MSGDRGVPPAWRARLLALAVERLPSLRYLILRRRFLRDSGWVASMRTRAPVDADRRPVPWYTYPAIRVLEKRVRPDMEVFEYGAGNSTLWWAERVQSVRAVESDSEWVGRLEPRLPANAEVHHEPAVDGGRYARFALESPAAYDVVVIDGEDRNGCATHAVEALKPDGVIVWDNADWSHRFAEGLAYLAAQGFRRLDFTGLGPLNGYAWTTAVLYRPQRNCLDI